MAVKSPRTRSRVENAVAWMDRSQGTAMWDRKRCRCTVQLNGEVFSSGWRKAFLTAVDAVRAKVEKAKKK